MHVSIFTIFQIVFKVTNNCNDICNYYSLFQIMFKLYQDRYILCIFIRNRLSYSFLFHAWSVIRNYKVYKKWDQFCKNMMHLRWYTATIVFNEKHRKNKLKQLLFTSTWCNSLAKPVNWNTCVWLVYATASEWLVNGTIRALLTSN
jgi:hypothetical protein